MKKIDTINSEKITIILPFIPPTINKYIGRSNIWEYQNDKKKLHKITKSITAGKNYNIKKCKMTVIYYFKDRRRRDPRQLRKNIVGLLSRSKYYSR